MADGTIILPDDSGNTGKKLDTLELTVGANTVERQRVVQGMDANRTFVSFTLNETAGSSTVALASCIINSQGSTVTSTNYTVPAGKTLRLHDLDIHLRHATSTTAVLPNYLQTWIVGTSSGTVATTMTTTQVIDRLTAGHMAGLSTTVPLATNSIATNNTGHPEGLEIPAGWNIGIVIVTLPGTQTSQVGLSLNGYLY